MTYFCAFVVSSVRPGNLFQEGKTIPFYMSSECKIEPVHFQTKVEILYRAPGFVIVKKPR